MQTTGQTRPERNLALVIEYDGTRYHGFQVQTRGVPTIQGEIERALAQIIGKQTRIAGAGRTDRGVHATGQLVSFHTLSPLPATVLQRAVNAVLPPDIVVLSAADVPFEFHARFSARSREYRYTILNRAWRSPLQRQFAQHVSTPLDVDLMAQAAKQLIGEQDFASFAGISEDVTSTVRRVLSVECFRDGYLVYVDIKADAFLPHMVRNIVGTLLLVGRGKIGLTEFQDILAARQRQEAGPTAPAHALCLTRVNY